MSDDLFAIYEIPEFQNATKDLAPIEQSQYAYFIQQFSGSPPMNLMPVGQHIKMLNVLIGCGGDGNHRSDYTKKPIIDRLKQANADLDTKGVNPFMTSTSTQ